MRVKKAEDVGIKKGLIDQQYDGIENCIGKIGVPVGVAGPFDMGGKESVLALATTESALIASVNRGAKILAQGAVDYSYENFGITRAPGFVFKTEKDAENFMSFVEDSFDDIKKFFDSGHLVLVDFECLIEENSVFVRFVAGSSDAMGMNMITIAVSRVVKEFILVESPVRIVDWVLSSNVCSDKKVASINIEMGRGIKSKTTVRLPFSVLDEYGLELQSVSNIYKLKYIDGSHVAGVMASNGHVANVIAATFLAYGQDMAHVLDSSTGVFEFEVEGDELVFSVELFNLLLGVVGGGTDLQHVKEFFKIGNIESKLDLAELISKGVLAGEISLFFSLCQHTLAESHNRLRKK